MEPSDLNPPPPDDAALETWLHTHAVEQPLPDDGFSHRVLAALPPRIIVTSTASARRRWLCAAAATIGLLIALGQTRLAWSDESERLSQVGASLVNTFGRIADPSLALALALMLGSLAYVYHRELRTRWFS